MVKNFHVPNMRAVRARIFRARAGAISKRQSSLARPKTSERVNESTQERTGGYLGITGDEGRSKLRKARGSC